jgi:hypothetical protein
MLTKKATKYVGRKKRFCRLNQTPPTENASSSDQSTQRGCPSYLDSYNRKRSQKTTTPTSVDYVWKLCFFVGTIHRICHFSDDFYSDSTLILTKIAVKY